MKATSILLAGLLLLACACEKDPAPVPPGTGGAGTPRAALSAPTPSAPVTITSAELGKPAPDFTLKDLDGKDVTLASFRGKVVVLEWFNPGCPFVNKAHTAGSLAGLAKKHAPEGVTWLAVNSAASGKQGFDVSTNQEAVKRFGMDHPVLRDETGAVGHAYAATNTPHMFVIDKNGLLVYSGAIDNSPDGEGQSPQGGSLVNYVDAALADLAAGRPVKTATSRAYGCSVKYGS